MGCDEESLSRLLGGIDKHIAGQVAIRYMEKYDKNLCDVIVSETGGNYQNALTTWVQQNDPAGICHSPDDCVGNIKVAYLENRTCIS